mmetsp:Transcript_96255/g.257374  ORF Transcript_96255/g.257374 Transcript_96255/m.257374 type:complete len:96 (-) Transcript_96255:453-740(-)
MYLLHTLILPSDTRKSKLHSARRWQRCYAGFEVLEAVGTFVGAFVLGFLVPDGTEGAIGGTWFFSGMLLVAFTLSGALYLALRRRACVRYTPALV